MYDTHEAGQIECLVHRVGDAIDDSQVLSAKGSFTVESGILNCGCSVRCQPVHQVNVFVGEGLIGASCHQQYAKEAVALANRDGD